MNEYIVFAAIINSDQLSDCDFEIKKTLDNERELFVSYKNHHSFSVKCNFFTQHYENDWADIVITLPKRAPDDCFDSDEDEFSYNLGNGSRDLLMKIISNNLKDFNEKINHSQGFEYQVFQKDRWSHRELCNFWPDRPELNDIY